VEKSSNILKLYQTNARIMVSWF